MSIRSNINLPKLKRSSNEKFKKIYEKAIKIMGSGNVALLYTFEQLEDFAKRYPQLKISGSVNGNINIKSRCDQWLVVNEDLFYTLYHEGTEVRHGKTVRNYHLQDVFYDLDFLLASVIGHDEYKISNANYSMDDINNIVSYANMDNNVNSQEIFS